MNRAPQPQACNHNRTLRRPRAIPPAQIQPSAILSLPVSGERDAGRQKVNEIHDRLAFTGHHEPVPNSQIQGTHPSKSP